MMVAVPRTVLVVDDEEPFLLSLIDGLKGHEREFRVLTARNGEEALAVFRFAIIDLLVTDMKMPEIDGIELLDFLDLHYPEVPVIVMTAFETPDLESRLRKLGVIRCLPKPLDLDELTKTILGALEERQLAESVPPTPLQLRPEPVTK